MNTYIKKILAACLTVMILAMTGCQTLDTIVPVATLETSIKTTTDTSKVRQNLATAMPGTTVTSVSITPVSGLFEVVAGKNVLYTDAEGHYMFVGSLYDMRNRVDMTAARVAEVSRIDFDKMPMEAAIVIKQGNGRNKLALFSDPDCPFCKKIEPELAKLKDTTIYVYLLPMPMHADARRKSAAVWCEPDRAKAWRNLMVSGLEPEKPAICDHPFTKVAELAKEHGVKATPTLVNQDGRVRPGYMASEQIVAWIKGDKS